MYDVFGGKLLGIFLLQVSGKRCPVIRMNQILKRIVVWWSRWGRLRWEHKIRRENNKRQWRNILKARRKICDHRGWLETFKNLPPRVQRLVPALDGFSFTASMRAAEREIFEDMMQRGWTVAFEVRAFICESFARRVGPRNVEQRTLTFTKDIDACPNVVFRALRAISEATRDFPS